MDLFPTPFGKDYTLTSPGELTSLVGGGFATLAGVATGWKEAAAANCTRKCRKKKTTKAKQRCRRQCRRRTPSRPPCVPEPPATTCAGVACATRTNNCGQTVTCPCPDQCPRPVGIWNAPPTRCGSTAPPVEDCTCERSTEGNNFCANGGDCPIPVRECTSTNGPEATSCRNLAGFNFVCQEAKTNQAGQFCGCGFGTTTGRVCMPRCDNPD